MLTESQVELIEAVESEYLRTRKAPTFERLASLTKLPIKQVQEEILTNEDVREALERLYLLDFYERKTEGLSGKQLLLLNILSNQHDRRPLSKKFKDAKVTPQQFNVWMRDPVFQQTLEQNVLQTFKDEGFRVFQSILETAAGGDISAAKFYMELTGRWTPTSNLNLNAKVEVHQTVDLLIEVIQRHIAPLPNGPQIIEAIGHDFDSILTTGQISLPSLTPAPVDSPLVPAKTAAKQKTEPLSNILVEKKPRRSKVEDVQKFLFDVTDDTEGESNGLDF